MVAIKKLGHSLIHINRMVRKTKELKSLPLVQVNKKNKSYESEQISLDHLNWPVSSVSHFDTYCFPSKIKHNSPTFEDHVTRNCFIFHFKKFLRGRHCIINVLLVHIGLLIWYKHDKPVRVPR